MVLRIPFNAQKGLKYTYSWLLTFGGKIKSFESDHKIVAEYNFCFQCECYKLNIYQNVQLSLINCIPLQRIRNLEPKPDQHRLERS